MSSASPGCFPTPLGCRDGSEICQGHWERENQRAGGLGRGSHNPVLPYWETQGEHPSIHPSSHTRQQRNKGQTHCLRSVPTVGTISGKLQKERQQRDQLCYAFEFSSTRLPQEPQIKDRAPQSPQRLWQVQLNPAVSDAPAGSIT